ncbi:MAG: FdhE protein [Thermoleophilaceae bacterium]|nr:FdhE protein [Thermoleophilaceae bacterium]
MSAGPAPMEAVTSPWAGRRLRAEELRNRYPFAADVLTLYLALLPVQEAAWRSAAKSPSDPEELSPWATTWILPAVVEATVAAGPATLAAAAESRLGDGASAGALAGWLTGAELDPVDRYLARAALGPVLEGLGERAGAACTPEQGEELCERCGGLPQLSCLASSGDPLVSGSRSLLCSRCGASWSCSRSICPACAEGGEDKLQVFAERLEGPVSGNGNGEDHADPVFPQLRIAGCSTCDRYLIEVDMARDERAVPEVDELVAIPLDLHAADQGLTKVTPNLMGF